MEYVITFIFAILIIFIQIVPSNNEVDVSQSNEVQVEEIAVEKPDYSDGIVVSLQDHESYTFKEDSISSEDINLLEKMISSGDFTNIDAIQDQKTKDLLNLSSYYSYNADLTEDNPYAPKLLIDDSIENEKLIDVFKQVQNNFGGLNTVDFEDDKVESNYSFEELEKYEYEFIKDGLSGATFYKYDIDHDGLDEIIAYVPGGSMGNFDYFIFQLNEDDTIEGENNISGIGSSDFVKIDGEYYIISNTMDYDTKELWCYNITTFDKNDGVKKYRMDYDKKSTIPILSDISYSSKFTENLDVDYFIDFYKDYTMTAIGEATNLEADVLSVLKNADNSYAMHTGIFDVNNDGVADYTNNYMAVTSNGAPSFYNVNFLDGETKSKSTEFTSDIYNLYTVIPCTYDEKNYFMVVKGNGSKSYLLSLVEIVDFQQVVLQNYFVVEKYDILAYEE